MFGCNHGLAANGGRSSWAGVATNLPQPRITGPGRVDNAAAIACGSSHSVERGEGPVDHFGCAVGHLTSRHPHRPQRGGPFAAVQRQIDDTSAAVFGAEPAAAGPGGARRMTTMRGVVARGAGNGDHGLTTPEISRGRGNNRRVDVGTSTGPGDDGRRHRGKAGAKCGGGTDTTRG